MASSQCGRKDELNHEEKVTLDELIDHAYAQDNDQQALAVVAQNDGLNTASDDDDNDPFPLPQLTTQLVGALQNQTRGSLSVFETHKWKGRIVNKFPNPLERTGYFKMFSFQNKGVKAAVVYTGKNKAGVECGWLLAFGNTKEHGKTIYAECGCKSKFINIDWTHLEKKLDAAGSRFYLIDNETRTKVYATIVGIGDRCAVGAVFAD